MSNAAVTHSLELTAPIARGGFRRFFDRLVAARTHEARRRVDQTLTHFSGEHLNELGFAGK